MTDEELEKWRNDHQTLIQTLTTQTTALAAKIDNLPNNSPTVEKLERQLTELQGQLSQALLSLKAAEDKLTALPTPQPLSEPRQPEPVVVAVPPVPSIEHQPRRKLQRL